MSDEGSRAGWVRCANLDVANDRSEHADVASKRSEAAFVELDVAHAVSGGDCDDERPCDFPKFVGARKIPQKAGLLFQ
jgi:hypothetical protein